MMIYHNGKEYNFRIEYDTSYEEDGDCWTGVFLTRNKILPANNVYGGYLSDVLDEVPGVFENETVRPLPWSLTKETLEEYLDKYNLIHLPVYMYSHSGETISTSPFSCRFDSGQIGWIVVHKSQVRKYWGWTRITKKRETRILDALEGVVQHFDCLLRGYIYGFINDDNGDSCWGFVGDPYGQDKQYLFNHIAEHADVPVEVVEKAFDNL